MFLESQAVAGLMHGLFICPMLIDRLLMNSAVLRQGAASHRSAVSSFHIYSHCLYHPRPFPQLPALSSLLKNISTCFLCHFTLPLLFSAQKTIIDCTRESLIPLLKAQMKSRWPDCYRFSGARYCSNEGKCLQLPTMYFVFL